MSTKKKGKKQKNKNNKRSSKAANNRDEISHSNGQSLQVNQGQDDNYDNDCDESEAPNQTFKEVQQGQSGHSENGPIRKPEESSDDHDFITVTGRRGRHNRSAPSSRAASPVSPAANLNSNPEDGRTGQSVSSGETTQAHEEEVSQNTQANVAVISIPVASSSSEETSARVVADPALANPLELIAELLANDSNSLGTLEKFCQKLWDQKNEEVRQAALERKSSEEVLNIISDQMKVEDLKNKIKKKKEQQEASNAAKSGLDLECDICFTDFEGNIVLDCTQCHNLICKPCYMALPRKSLLCPFCRADFRENQPVRNRAIERLISR